jgi:hypothetical protein
VSSDNPGFKHFIDESGLPFHPHAHFMRADLDARQRFYGSRAERIGNPERLDLEAAS